MVTVNKGPLGFYLVTSSFGRGSVLPCVMMARERTETCSIHVKAQLSFK